MRQGGIFYVKKEPPVGKPGIDKQECILYNGRKSNIHF